MTDFYLPAAFSIVTGWFFGFCVKENCGERDMDLAEVLVQGKGRFGVFSLSNRVI